MRTPLLLLLAAGLSGCAYPWTPPALSPVTQPAPAATAGSTDAARAPMIPR